MSSWWSRLWMAPKQKLLENPEDYVKPLDPKAVLSDLYQDRMAKGDPEMFGYMTSQLRSYQEGKKPLTIAAIDRDAESMKGPFPEVNGKIHEELVAAGTSFDILASYLVRRANKAS